MTLKSYQTTSLETLRSFFRTAQHCYRQGIPKPLTVAFAQHEPLEGRQKYYDSPLENVRGIPNVCFRIPTGGGKTLLAAHAVGIAAEEWLQSDAPVVLWLAPSGKIVEQTLRALRNPRHFYHEALKARFSSVNVLSVDEALRLTKSTLDEGVTVLVSTLQSFRRESKDGLRVYAENGALMSHFEGLPESVRETLLKHPESHTVERSLANVLRLRRPIVVVDEAHNAKTSLSFTTLARFAPACVLEFTATPNTIVNERQEIFPSNILVSVGAKDLANEEMIKMPLWVDTRSTWERTLGDAIARLNALQEEAVRETAAGGEYVRPMMLIKAQSGSDADLSPEKVKDILMNVNDYNIPAGAIAIEADGIAELTGVDLMRRDCEVRFVITKEKLREGWDCPFAYVLCVLQNITSPTAVEQLVGRVMRLPYARKRRSDALNKGYVFSMSEYGTLAKTLDALEGALVQSGFNIQEAKELIHYDKSAQTEAFEDDDMTLFGVKGANAGSVSVDCPETPTLGALPEELRTKVQFNETAQTLTLTDAANDLTDEEITSLENTFRTEAGKDAARWLRKKVHYRLETERKRKPSPCEKGEEFAVPALVVKTATNEMLRFDADFIVENADYSFNIETINLSPELFPDKEADAHGEGVITLEDGKIRQADRDAASELHDRQLVLLSGVRDWNEITLSRWIDAKLLRRDMIEKADSLAVIRALMRHLTKERMVEFAALVRRKHELRGAVQEFMDAHIQNAQRALFARFMNQPSVEALHRDPAYCFTMPPKPDAYTTFPQYSGSYTFTKHYYPFIGDMTKSEVKYAVELDRNSKISCWVRNIPKHPQSLYFVYDGSKKFYPDFVCKTASGKYLVVEPHGKHLDDFTVKAAAGQLWAKQSGNAGVFVMMSSDEMKPLMDVLRVL
jgi:type III restriction enzyme